MPYRLAVYPRDMTTAAATKFSRNKYGQYVTNEWVTMWGKRQLVSFIITKGKPSYNGFSGWWAEYKVLSFGSREVGSIVVAPTLVEAKAEVVKFIAQGYGTVES